VSLEGVPGHTDNIVILNNKLNQAFFCRSPLRTRNQISEKHRAQTNKSCNINMLRHLERSLLCARLSTVPPGGAAAHSHRASPDDPAPVNEPTQA